MIDQPPIPDQAAFAKDLLCFGGLLDLPLKRDPLALISLPYVKGEVVAIFSDTCNLGNLAIPDEKWKIFVRETRESARKWTEAVGIERYVRIQISYSPSLEYDDLRICRTSVIVTDPCVLMVPTLIDEWWNKQKKLMERFCDERGLPYTEPKEEENDGDGNKN